MSDNIYIEIDEARTVLNLACENLQINGYQYLTSELGIKVSKVLDSYIQTLEANHEH
jgi:hypothetical protein